MALSKILQQKSYDYRNIIDRSVSNGSFDVSRLIYAEQPIHLTAKAQEQTDVS